MFDFFSLVQISKTFIALIYQKLISKKAINLFEMSSNKFLLVKISLIEIAAFHEKVIA
jgi:hypothetical protein